MVHLRFGCLGGFGGYWFAFGFGILEFLAGEVFHEALELIAAGMVLQFSQGFGFDLTNPFAGDLKDSSGLFEGVAVTVTQSVAELNNFPLTVGEAFEDMSDFVLEQFVSRRIERIDFRTIFEEIAEAAVFTFPDRECRG